MSHWKEFLRFNMLLVQTIDAAEMDLLDENGPVHELCKAYARGEMVGFRARVNERETTKEAVEAARKAEREKFEAEKKVAVDDAILRYAQYSLDPINLHVEDMVRREREACAAIAESCAQYCGAVESDDGERASTSIMQNIRARSNRPPAVEHGTPNAKMKVWVASQRSKG